MIYLRLSFGSIDVNFEGVDFQLAARSLNFLGREQIAQMPVIAQHLDHWNAIHFPDADRFTVAVVSFQSGHVALVIFHQQEAEGRDAVVNATVFHLLQVDENLEFAGHEQVAFGPMVIRVLATLVAQRPPAPAAQVGAVHPVITRKADGSCGLFWTNHQRLFEADRFALADVVSCHQVPLCADERWNLKKKPTIFGDVKRAQ